MREYREAEAARLAYESYYGGAPYLSRRWKQAATRLLICGLFWLAVLVVIIIF